MAYLPRDRFLGLLGLIALGSPLSASAAASCAARGCSADPAGGRAECSSDGSVAGSLLLQTRHKWSSASGVCDADSPVFSAALCHEMTIGVREPKHLLEPERWANSPSLLVTGVTKCARKFHALSPREAEELQPHLAHCLLSTWAAKIYRSLTQAPCAEASPEDADLVVLPGYTATECNWPIFGGGVCSNQRDGLSNLARRGSVCRGEDTLLAYRAIQRSLGKHTVVLESSPNPNGDKYDLPDGRIYAEPNMSWALVGADLRHYRRGTDISLPPGPSARCRVGGPASPVARSFGAPLESKAYLASFKGSFSSHPFRYAAREALHDGKRVVVSDKADPQWGFDELLFSSVFSLILRGDDIMTYRVNEAVCSGGIPVLVTDSWVPPFNETVPFETFGLIHDERDLWTLRGRLEGVSSRQRNRLREAARKVCADNFQTIDTHALTMAQAVGHTAKGRLKTKVAK
uniref:Exostosin GT47 domain-containing protein n=1 Tax=Alexandrium monilatum TaxID=311494 RepID=A0A7S4RLZ7_9DINO